MVAVAERYYLDPVEVATGRTELEITPWVDAEGIDYGDGEIAAYMADMERGSSPVDYRIPNRQIVIPLILKTSGTTTFAQIRLLLQKKVARIQQEGGWIKRTTASGSTVFADVVNATLKLGGDWMQGRTNNPVDINAELRLEAIPDWYGAEITLPDRVEVTNSELIWTETGVLGDYPGRLRLVVDNDQAGAPQLGLLWGIRSRHYSNSTTAQLKYEAETCTPLDAAGIGGGVLSHSNLSTTWTAILSTNQGAAALTHTGTYRVWARAAAVPSIPGSPLPSIRLVWDVGDFALPSENAPVQIPGPSLFYVVDLGEVRLDRVPAGSHRWQGIIQGRGVAGGENVQFDKIWFQPVDEGAGVLRAPVNYEPGLSSYLARDEFNQTAGAVSGKAAPVGGSWAGVAGSDTDDFVVEATGHNLQRSAVSDAVNTGRLIRLGSGTATDVVAQAAISRIVPIGVPAGGGGGPPPTTLAAGQMVAARVSSFANHLRAGWGGTGWAVQKVVGGVPTNLASVGASFAPNNWMAMRLYVSAAGLFSFWAWPSGSPPTKPTLTGFDAQLATGGPLASGGWGLYDIVTPPIAFTRLYDAFSAWVPATDAVLHPSQSAELRTEGMFREEATGAAFGPVSHVVGDLPRIPASGSESRTVQFFLKASRGDFAGLPDTGTDDLSARVTYRPSALFLS